MPTERQVAANRQNAKKSTGPRSSRGKKRASRNALRHGLTKLTSGAEFEREAERLARQLAEEGEDNIVLEHAREAAQAELELHRVRWLALAHIERASAFGRFDVAKIFRTHADEVAWVVQYYLGGAIRKARQNLRPTNCRRCPQRARRARWRRFGGRFRSCNGSRGMKRARSSDGIEQSALSY